MNEHNKKILVIKLSALGDFIQALGPMAAIRKHHPDADITLLTTKPYVKFGQNCGYFDHIMIDQRPSMFNLKGWYKLYKSLHNGKFDRVYDLQNNDRTNIYFKILKRKNKPEWAGTTRGATFENKEGHNTSCRSSGQLWSS